jgi:PKD repeat protein
VFRSGVSIDYDKVFIGGRDGYLYARSILNAHAPVVNGPYNIVVEAHNSVLFQVTASDPEGNLLSYSWDFGDGNSSTEVSPLHEYPSPGEYTVEVTVSDGTKVKRHAITVIVNPFETETSDGDEATLPLAMIGGAVAAIVVVLLLVFLLIIRRRGEPAGTEEVAHTEEETHAEEVAPLDVVVVDAPMVPEKAPASAPPGTGDYPTGDPNVTQSALVDEDISWEETQ